MTMPSPSPVPLSDEELAEIDKRWASVMQPDTPVHVGQAMLAELAFQYLKPLVAELRSLRSSPPSTDVERAEAGKPYSEEVHRANNVQMIAVAMCMVANIEPIDSADGSSNWWMFNKEAAAIVDNLWSRFKIREQVAAAIRQRGTAP
jgi:hypothetical protein